MAKLSAKEQALLDALGVKLSNDDYITPVEKEEHTKEMAKWEAQSLLVSLKWPYPELVPVECWNPTCKKRFLTNYKANVYCSMECHKIELERKGIVWRPERSFYEQWGNLEPPIMIPPEAIKAMRRLLSIVDQESPVVSRSPKQDSGGVLKDQMPWIDEPDLPIPSNDPDIPEEPEITDSESEDSFLSLLASLDDS